MNLVPRKLKSSQPCTKPRLVVLKWKFPTCLETVLLWTATTTMKIGLLAAVVCLAIGAHLAHQDEPKKDSVVPKNGPNSVVTAVNVVVSSAKNFDDNPAVTDSFQARSCTVV